MTAEYAVLPRVEPWQGLPSESRGEERINRLHREIEEYRVKKSGLQSDWDCVQDFIRELYPADQQRICEMFCEAIRGCEQEMQSRQIDICDIREGAI